MSVNNYDREKFNQWNIWPVKKQSVIIMTDKVYT